MTGPRNLLSLLLGALLRTVPLLAMVVPAAGTYWLVRLNTPDTGKAVMRPKEHIADYTLGNFAVTALGPTGQTRYRINGEKMVHYEDDETTEVFKPAIRIFSPGKPDVTLRADTALMSADGAVLDLHGDAQIDRPADGKSEALMGRSIFFRALINEDILKTDEAVELTQGKSTITAKGMIFNNVTREVQLLAQVRGFVAAK